MPRLNPGAPHACSYRIAAFMGDDAAMIPSERIRYKT
jgi:hypothetical protein